MGTRKASGKVIRLAGTGTPNHRRGLMKVMTGAEMTHVPYKGGGPAGIDLLAGRIQAIFGSIPQWQPHLAVGKVRAIGIGHPTRLRSLPDVPAIAETLPGFNNTSWYGLVGPVGTPTPIINKLNAEMKRAVATPEFAKHVESIGMEPASSTPKEMGDLIRTELARWTKVIKAAGIKRVVISIPCKCRYCRPSAFSSSGTQAYLSDTAASAPAMGRHVRLPLEPQCAASGRVWPTVCA